MILKKIFSVSRIKTIINNGNKKENLEYIINNFKL
jgi:hypothetical protein